MTIQQAGQQLIQQLATIYDSREAANIAGWVLEHLTGWKKSERIINKQYVLEPDKEQLLKGYTQELLQHKPVQYVLHESWFCGMKLYVDENVLIPRPETEELVEWIASEFKGGKIVDIGTGSGCIAIALKKKLPQSDVTACDISEQALAVANKNKYADITLIKADILDSESWSRLPSPNVIVSNPPYIPLKDKNLMRDNVLQYEPHIALFVEDNDPLLFYRAIAAFAKTNLLPGGATYVEIHEDLGSSVQEVFQANGFSRTEIRKDMQGKDRMVKASAT